MLVTLGLSLRANPFSINGALPPAGGPVVSPGRSVIGHTVRVLQGHLSVKTLRCSKATPTAGAFNSRSIALGKCSLDSNRSGIQPRAVHSTGGSFWVVAWITQWRSRRELVALIYGHRWAAGVWLRPGLIKMTRAATALSSSPMFATSIRRNSAAWGAPCFSAISV